MFCRLAQHLRSSELCRLTLTSWCKNSNYSVPETGCWRHSTCSDSERLCSLQRDTSQTSDGFKSNVCSSNDASCTPNVFVPTNMSDFNHLCYLKLKHITCTKGLSGASPSNQWSSCIWLRSNTLLKHANFLSDGMFMFPSLASLAPCQHWTTFPDRRCPWGEACWKTIVPWSSWSYWQVASVLWNQAVFSPLDCE